MPSGLRRQWTTITSYTLLYRGSAGVDPQPLETHLAVNHVLGPDTNIGMLSGVS
jgi:hypothetical protein